MATKKDQDEPRADAAIKAEAAAADGDPKGVDPDTITVSWNGRDWTVPASLDQLPATAERARELGHSMGFIEATLGPQQWRRFIAGRRNTVADAADLMNTIVRDGMGIDLGE